MDLRTLIDPEALFRADALAARPLTSFLDNSGRTAVVTGAALGLGLAIAMRLLESGANVMLADIRTTALNDAIDTLPDEYRQRARTFTCDVAKSGDVARLADSILENFGSLDFWVNNAGIFPPTGPIAQADDATLDRLLDVNVRGTFTGAREAARRMDKGGVILNIASIGAMRGQAGMSGYSASKHAVLGLTRSLARELGPQGIRVMAIAPGLSVSPGNGEALESVVASGHKLATLSAPLGRIALADDIARVAMFALSDLSAMMTGQMLVVDGGTTV